MRDSRLVKIFIEFTIIVLVAGALLGCGQDTNKNKSGSSTPSPTQPQPIISEATISGSITVAKGLLSDSDVNDPNADYSSNDSTSTAQNIPGSTTVGGYVNIAGTGNAGRSFDIGDPDDYYLAQLSAGQAISFTATDFDLTASPPNQLTLELIDQSTGLVVQTTSASQPTQIVDIQNDGIYYLHVSALSGASRYVMTLGLINQIQTNANIMDISQVDFVPGEVIVEYKQPQVSTNFISASALAAKISALATSTGLAYKAGAPDRSMLMGLVSASGTSLGTISTLGIVATHKAINPTIQQKLDTIAVVKALRKRSDVASARLNYIRRLNAIKVPDDEYYSPRQWHYPAIQLPEAWGITTGNSDVIVAVIDTGVLLNHPDLQGQLIAGYDFIQNANLSNDKDGIDPNPDDPGDDLTGKSSFHGTHVSGTIAAWTNNGKGVAGIGWNVKIMPLRALGLKGGTDYDIEQAIRFAARLPNDSKTLPSKKADIINMSLGGVTDTTAPPEAFKLARQAGVIIVAAAGNETSSSLNYPASLDGVVSVSATTISKTLAYYSNFGSTIDIAAPGGEYTDVNKDGYYDAVYSTLGSDATGTIQMGYGFYIGTSMASPHVAGVVALMKSVNSSLTPDQFDQLLSAGQLTDLLPGQTGRSSKFGYGQIDAFKAVNAAQSLLVVPPPPPPAVADVVPSALNYGAATKSLDINVTNTGSGNLNVVKISNDSGGWLTVKATNVDANGLGQYTVQVDRTGLPQITKSYMATISIVTSNNTLTIPVLMVVYVENINDNTGYQYVVLQDSVTRKTVQKVVATKINGKYQYKFEKVALGSYYIFAGTDTDNDNKICEMAEACGSYLNPNTPMPIVVDGKTSALTGFNFQASIDTTAGPGDVTLSKLQKRPENVSFIPVQ